MSNFAYFTAPLLLVHVMYRQAALFNCVCFSKPNPPAGEDLRDSHQHFDGPPPTLLPLTTKPILTFALSWGGEEGILYDLNIQSFAQNILKILITNRTPTIPDCSYIHCPRIENPDPDRIAQNG